MAHRYYLVNSATLTQERVPTELIVDSAPAGGRHLLASGQMQDGTTPSSVSTGNLSAGASVAWAQFTTEASAEVPTNAQGGSWPGVATWPTGTYSFIYNVTAAGASLTFGALVRGSAEGHFGRMTNAGDSHRGYTGADAANSGTGLKTSQIASWTPPSGSYDDRLEVMVACTRAAGGHGNESADMELDDPNADSTTNGGVVTTPHSDSPPALTGNISRVGSPVYTEADNGNITGASAPSYPTGITAGDYVLAAVLHADGTNPTLTAPTGFTSVASSNDSNSKLQVWEYFYTGSGDPALEFSSSVTNDMALLVVAYRGVATTGTRYGLTPATTASPGSNLDQIFLSAETAGIGVLFQGVDPATSSISPFPILPNTAVSTTPHRTNALLQPDGGIHVTDSGLLPAMILQGGDHDQAGTVGTHRVFSDLATAGVLHGIYFLVQEEEAGQTVAVGTLAETDSPNTVTAEKPIVASVGTLDETETLVSAAGSKSVAVGTVSELESLVSAAGRKLASVGTVLEVESLVPAVPLVPQVVDVGTLAGFDVLSTIAAIKPIIQTVGTLAGSDVLIAVEALKPIVVPVGTLAGTDVLVPVGAVKPIVVPVGTLAGTDVLVPVSSGAIVTVGTLAELDTLRAVVGIKTAAVGTLSELESLVSVAARKTGTVGTLAELESLVSATLSKTIDVGTLAELETLLAVAGRKLGPVGTLGNVDTLLSVLARKTSPVGTLAELETLLGIAGRKASPVGTVAELETLRPVDPAKLANVGTLFESDLLRSIGAGNVLPVSTLAELESLVPVVGSKVVAVGTVAELDVLVAVALVQGSAQTIDVGTFAELESLVSVARVQPIIRPVGTLAETNLLVPNTAGKFVPISTLAETELLVPATGRKLASIGTLSELDALLPVTAQQPIAVAVGTLSEADSPIAVALVAPQVIAVGTLAELDALNPIGPIVVIPEWWIRNPAGFGRNPVGLSRNPVPFVRVGSADPTPW